MKPSILLSGGWGYGNLGDNAILLSSCELIFENFGDCDLVVMSYDVQETTNVLKRTDIRVVESVHRSRFGKLAFRELGVYQKFRDSEHALFETILRRCEKAYNKLSYFINSQPVFSLNKYDTYFQQCDYFIMSGGGYFNMWESSFFARIEEISLAAKFNKPILLIGQTFGDFLGKYAAIFKAALQHVTCIIVRDQYSCSDIEGYGFPCMVMPDIALLEHGDYNSVDTITIIPGQMKHDQVQLLVRGVVRYVQRDMSIKLLSTRLYNKDIHVLHDMKSVFFYHDLTAQVIVPTSYNMLLKEIVTSSIVISKNLHGLILAWRCQIPIVSLNNEKKVMGFLSQVQLSSAFLDLTHSTEEDICSLLLQQAKKPPQAQECVLLADKVREAFAYGVTKLRQHRFT